MEGGSNTSGRTVFKDLDEGEARSTIQDAWKNREKVGGLDSQGPNRTIQRWMGRSGRWVVGGYYNVEADLVESAFPIFADFTEDGSLRVHRFWPKGY